MKSKLEFRILKFQTIVYIFPWRLSIPNKLPFLFLMSQLLGHSFHHYIFSSQKSNCVTWILFSKKLKQSPSWLELESFVSRECSATFDSSHNTCDRQSKNGDFTSKLEEHKNGRHKMTTNADFRQQCQIRRRRRRRGETAGGWRQRSFKEKKKTHTDTQIDRGERGWFGSSHPSDFVIS